MLILGQLTANERFFEAPPGFIDAVEKALPEHARLEVCTSMDDFRLALPTATGVVGYPFSASLLDDAPHLRFVHLLTAGVPESLEAACSGLRLSSSAGLNARSVAEHALFLVLAAARGVSHRGLGAWEPDAYRPARPLSMLRVTVIGYGAIGAHLASLLDPLVGSVTVLSRSPREEPTRMILGFDALFETCIASDVIAVALPNRPETRALFGSEFFDLLTEDVALINVARGALFDEQMLLAFLAEHPDARYLTDVAAIEPYPDDGLLRTSPSVLITPHVGGRSIDIWPALTSRAVAEIHAALEI